ATVSLGGRGGEPGSGDFEPGELQAGTDLEHFRIVAPLGRGGMGAVYRALDLSLERFVAVKVIRPDRALVGRSGAASTPTAAETPPAGKPQSVRVAGAVDQGVTILNEPAPPTAPSPTPDLPAPDSPTHEQPTGSAPLNSPRSTASTASTGSGSLALDRLLQEARAQARVNHPNVAHVYFVSPDPEKPFLAMELVEGPTLADKMKQGALPYGAVTRIGGEIASALACAAKYDIVHGDVKPSNVLLSGGSHDGDGRLGTVKLSDFGLARQVHRQRSGGLEGTPNYLAPEVVRGGTPTAQSDLYALGVTLFEMTFGRLPYTTDRNRLTDRLGAHLHNKPEFPEPWPKDLPPGWKAVLASLLAKNPDDRPADADAAARAIQALAPQSNTPAGLLVRSLAAGTDLAFVFIASMILVAVFAVPALTSIPDDIPYASALLAEIPLALLSMLGGATPSLLLAWWQSRGHRTLGRRLFQVRVVDRFGLRPARRVLFLRGLAQTAPAWGVALFGMIGEFTGLGWLEGVPLLFVTVIWVLDVLFGVVSGLIGGEPKTLHDRILRTRVVLDTVPRRGAPE
ncbi:MAG: protein kinase, partial [Planctomycetota bacterium]